MAKHVLVQNGVIINCVELEPNNYTTNATEAKNTGKWLVPYGCELIQTTLGNIGDTWPLPEQEG